MKGRFLLHSGESEVEKNIYADKSSIVLDWLLKVGVKKEYFSLRELARDREVSLGLIHKVFEVLIFNGLLKSKGVRTSKTFSVNKPELLLRSWLEHYNIIKKCKMWTYHSRFETKEEMLCALDKSGLSHKVVLALHSAAEAYGCKNTNLNTLELYMIQPDIRTKLEATLQLTSQERGYEVLLIKPYYKSLLKMGVRPDENISVSSELLTFLDLFHFPLRGQEQAEFMAERVPELKRIYSWS